MKRLRPPAAAISSARFALSWPLMSFRSSGVSGVSRTFGFGRISTCEPLKWFASWISEPAAMISISGLAFRDGEEATADVVRLVPADRLLVETDSPVLSPPGAPRGRNAPEWVAITAQWVADRREMDPEDLGDALVSVYDALLHRPVGTPS